MESTDDTSPFWQFWASLDVIPFDEVVRIAIIVVVALITHIVITKIIRSFVRRTIEKAPAKQKQNRSGREDPDEIIEQQLEERTVQRAQAFGTLLRSAAVIIIWTVTGITVLSILGINVTPILASAGVAGVVIGFGAQTLVADYLAGISMIFEDQLGVGDIVDTGQVLGVVEEVALRYTRIRDFSGTVWYIRNGQMQYVANQSQGWTFLSIDMAVDFDTDLNQLRDVVNAEGKRLFEEQGPRGDLLEAPYFGGLEAVAGDAVTARIIGRLKPANQFAAIRRVRGAMKTAFDAHGIDVPQQIIQIDEMPRRSAGPTLES